MGAHGGHQLESVRGVRGFSIAEALLATFLIFMILGTAASLFQNYSSIMRHSSPKERSLVGGQVALDRIRCELPAAVVMHEPALASTSLYNRVVFEKIDPSVTSRLPVPVPDAWSMPAFGWDPNSPSHCCLVEYSVDSGDLVRKVWGAGYSAQELMAEGVVGLNSQMNTRSSVNLTLSMSEDGRTRRVTTETSLWIRQ